MKAVFISDVHLQSGYCADAQKLVAYLDRLVADATLTHLFLLGDIFDLWVGSGDFFYHRYFPVIDRCLFLKDRGVEIHFFEGNHDFHLRNFFSQSLGFFVHENVKVFRWSLGNENKKLLVVRVEHGDQMDPTDKGYLFLRWLWRTPIVKFLAETLPGWAIAALGDFLSRRSRKYTSQTKTIDANAARQKIRRHAELMARKDPFDVLVSGHVHVADDINLQVADHVVRSVNLGTWLDAPRAVVITTDVAQKSWNLQWVDL